MEKHKVWVNHRISLPNEQTIECPIIYKHVSSVIGAHEFPKNLMQFDMSEFHIILRTDQLTTHGENTDHKDLKVTLKEQEVKKYAFIVKGMGKSIS